MSPYLLLIAGSLSGGPLLAAKPNTRRAYLLAMGLLCWLLSSLRYVTGFDYRFYETVFQNTAGSGLSGLALLGQIEPGYLLLNLTVASVGGDYRAFLFVFHLLFTLLVFVWMGRYSPSPWLSVYLFLTLQYFALSMNFLRQAMAAAILLWIYPFLKRRRFLPCLGIILLAACFHRTALIMVPLCLLLSLGISRLHYSLAALATGAAYLLLDPLVQVAVRLVPKYQHYLTERYWQGNSFLYLLLPVGCFLFVLPLLKGDKGGPPASPVLANCMFYSMLIQLFITRHFILERLSIYPAFFCLLALPEAALLGGESRRSRICTGILLAGGLAYFFFAASQGFHGVYPFRGVWDRALSP